MKNSNNKNPDQRKQADRQRSNRYKEDDYVKE